MTLIIERLAFKRRVRPIAVLCVAMILAGAGLIAAPGLNGGTIDPCGFLWAVLGPLIYALYLTANARLMGRHPPLVGAGFLYLGFTASYLVAVLVLGLEWPQSPGDWQALLFVALGAGALMATLFS
jgi:drug/metabolite transporter (DMT)-like permease